MGQADNRVVRPGRARSRGTATLCVLTPVGEVAVDVERKQVKNLNLRIRPDGSVHLSMPRRATQADAEDFLRRRAAWIAAHLVRREERAEDPQRRRYDRETNTLPLWGTLVDLDEALARAGLRSTRPPSTDRMRANLAEELIDDLYRREVERALPAVIERAEARVGAHAARWQVRRMKSRWGSCTPARGSIRIGTGLAAYPPACFEMVVCHELVHLVEPSHNDRFHALLDAACPANRALSRLLAQPPRAVAAHNAPGIHR